MAKRKINLISAFEIIREGLNRDSVDSDQGGVIEETGLFHEKMQLVMQFFRIREDEARLLTIISMNALNSQQTSIEDMLRALDEPISHVYRVRSMLDSFVKRSWIFREPMSSRTRPLDILYDLSNQCMRAVVEADRKLLKRRVPKNITEHLLECSAVIQNLLDSKGASTDFLVHLKALHQKGMKYPFIAWLDALKLPIEQLAICYYVIGDRISGHEYSESERLLRYFFPDRLDRQTFRLNLVNGKLDVIQKGLLVVESKQEVRLLDILPGKKLLSRMVDFGLIEIKSNSSANRFLELIEHENIIQKELFFSPELDRDLDVFRRLCQPGNMDRVKQKLEAEKKGKGILVLFHGVPGSGKTESVLQIAAATGRNVLRVETGKIRSKWVGESEQNILRIFEEYKACMLSETSQPILLFNEADALLGRRMSNVGNSADQMNNTMQNILLESFEHFEGILVATTNLVENLDAAFDRRFLYKFRFERAGNSVQQHIWKQQLPFVEESVLRILSSEFELSPAEIENIGKKCSIRMILEDGWTVDLDILRKMAMEESGVRKRKSTPIGFHRAVG
jgi:hypothetical protein